MTSAAGLAQASLFALAVLAGVGAAVGTVAPDLADDAMTMATMSDWMGEDRYQDRGTCDFHAVNMSNPTDEIERDFACSFYWDWSLYQDGDAYVHEVLYDLEEDEIFQVPEMERGRMHEFYHVDGHMLTEDALTFQRADPEAGVLMPPPGARGNVSMGWVESGGERGGHERLVLARDLQEVGTQQVDGLEAVRWNSTVEREPVTWHGYEAYMTEHVTLVNDPETAWVLEMRRHVLVEMTPAQMADAFGQPPPSALGDPGGPEPVMELTYRTSAAAIDDHADKAREFQRMMWPIDHGDEIDNVAGASAGFLLVGGLATRTVRKLVPDEER